MLYLSLVGSIAAMLATIACFPMGFFPFRTAPPPPPPEPTAPAWMVTLASLIVVALAIVGVLAFIIARRWRQWFNAAVDKAFKATDLDGSGNIDKNELYVGVCELYLNLHLYGLNVKAPDRSQVLKIMSSCDDDNVCMPRDLRCALSRHAL